MDTINNPEKMAILARELAKQQHKNNNQLFTKKCYIPIPESIDSLIDDSKVTIFKNLEILEIDEKDQPFTPPHPDLLEYETLGYSYKVVHPIRGIVDSNTIISKSKDKVRLEAIAIVLNQVKKQDANDDDDFSLEDFIIAKLTVYILFGCKLQRITTRR